jgi:hypothetical protein
MDDHRAVIRRSLMIVAAAAAGACASARRPLPPPVFTRGVWRIRIDVDSAPSRHPSNKPVFGTINFSTATYAIDFNVAINRSLSKGAHVTALPQHDDDHSAVFKITLGDSSSYDDKIVFLGHQVARDSIAGTWAETILCCAAGGRFSLWRAATER